MWILSKFVLLDSGSYIAVLWSKLFIMLIYYGIMVILSSIFEEIHVDKGEYWIYIICCSLLVFIPVFDLGQYDSFSIFFGMLGIWRTLKEDRFSLLTLLLFSVSVAFKFIFALVIAVVLLIKHKDVKTILKEAALICVVPALFYLFFSYIKSLHASTISGLLLHYSGKFLSTVMPSGTESISLLMAAIFFVYVCAYEMEIPKNNKDYISRLSWLSFAIYFSIYIFGVEIHPQWELFMGLFVIILFATSDIKDANLFIYETLFEGTLLVQHANYYKDIFFNENRFSYIFKDLNIHLISVDNKVSMNQIFETYNLQRFMVIIAAAFLVMGVVILFKTFPGKKDQGNGENIINDKKLKIYRISKIALLLLYLFIFVSFRILI